MNPTPPAPWGTPPGDQAPALRQLPQGRSGVWEGRRRRAEHSAQRGPQKEIASPRTRGGSWRGQRPLRKATECESAGHIPCPALCRLRGEGAGLTLALQVALVSSLNFPCPRSPRVSGSRNLALAPLLPSPVPITFQSLPVTERMVRSIMGPHPRHHNGNLVLSSPPGRPARPGSPSFFP